MLSNIVEVFMQFWTELLGVIRVTVRGDTIVFRGTFKFDNFCLNYHVEANQVNFSPFSYFELGTHDVHYSAHPNVHVIIRNLYATLQKQYFTDYVFNAARQYA